MRRDWSWSVFPWRSSTCGRGVGPFRRSERVLSPPGLRAHVHTIGYGPRPVSAYTPCSTELWRRVDSIIEVQVPATSRDPHSPGFPNAPGVFSGRGSDRTTRARRRRSTPRPSSTCRVFLPELRRRPRGDRRCAPAWVRVGSRVLLGRAGGRSRRAGSAPVTKCLRPSRRLCSLRDVTSSNPRFARGPREKIDDSRVVCTPRAFFSPVGAVVTYVTALLRCAGSLGRQWLTS